MRATRTIYRLITALCIGIVGLNSAHAICFVSASATGANNGASWSNAYTNPQFALLRSDCNEIWVAKGVYKPTLGLDPSVSFVIPSGVEMYGGFIGDETARDSRRPAVNLTVLSG